MGKTYAYIALLLCAGCGGEGGLNGGEDLASGGDGSASLGDMAMAGGCQPKCAGLTPHCNATQHCVACLTDADCAMGSYCKIISDAVAICTPGCMSDDRCANGQKCCGNQCTDTQKDARHCGACDMPCSSAHAQPTCMAGVCQPGKCEMGWGDCNKDAMDGCEANLHADPNNCTACGMGCMIANAFAGCADGCYATACKFGFDDCNLNAMDGCETSVLTDKNNCGGCGKPCLALPNATANCTNGSCLLGKCNAGFENCDGMAANGCEVKIDSDAKNCGGCGKACAQGLVCIASQCTCAMCNFPNAAASCVNNMCILGQCNAGYLNCDMQAGNGCEVDSRFDPKNCGMCGKACGMGEGCINSVCVMTMCGDMIVQMNEEYEPPPGPFMSVKVDAQTCRWHFENVTQLYCNGTCSWAGQQSCDQADADIFCKLKTGNPNSVASAFQKGVAQAQPGFPCPGGNYGVKIGKLPLRGVMVDVYYQDTSLSANHGMGEIISQATCTNP